MSSQEQISALKTTIAKLEARHTNNMNVILDLMSEHATLKSVFLNSENSRKSLQNQNEFLEEQLKEHSRNSHHMKYEDFCKKTNLELIKINFDLKNKVSELEKFKHSEYYNVSLSKKISDFIEQEKKVIPNDQLKFETARKAFISKIETDKLTIRKLSKQASDLQQDLLLERKSSESKCLELSTQISELHDLLNEERKTFENAKKDALKKNVLISEMNKSFENKKKILDEDIPKLLKKLSDLQSNFVTEKNLRFELKGKYDLLEKERDYLSDKIKKLEKVLEAKTTLNFSLSDKERDHLVCKIKELEDEISKQKQNLEKVESIKQLSPDTAVLSPFKDYSDSDSDSTIASSPVQKMTTFSNSSYSSKSYDSSNSQTSNSNRFYNNFVAKSNNSKKIRMVWRKKSTTDDSVGKLPHHSPVVDAKSLGSKTELPCFVRTLNQLISLSAKTISCSTCGTSDFVNKRFNQKWYGTYSIPHSSFVVSKANLKGPNKVWVPKFVNPFWQG